MRPFANFCFRSISCAILASSAVLGWALLSESAPAAMLAPEEGGPTGPKDWPADPASHVVVIKREAKDDKQVAMIAAAEAAPTAQDALQEAAKQAQEGGHPPAIPKDGKAWWYQEKLGIRIPYAITGDAVTYYSGILTAYAKKGFKSYSKPSSSLSYQASVRFHEEFKLDGKVFKGVNVVTMQLTFSANFTAEATSGIGFEKNRVVVLDAGNKVLHLSGDGPTEAAIMML